MSQPEARLRARCRMWLDQCLPAPAVWSSIEHGRKHTGTPEQRAREWQRLKAQGVRPGLADVMIWLCGRFIGIELKAGRNTTSEAQDAWGAAIRTLGHGYYVVRSVSELASILTRSGVALTPSALSLADAHDRELACETPVKKTGPRRLVKRRDEAAQVAALARVRARGVIA